MSRIVRSAVLSACLLFTAIACTPTKGPSEKSPSPGPTPSVKVEKPKLIEAATKRSDAGAKAFVTYYYALVKYGHATGDWTELKRLSWPSCSICKRFWEKGGGRLPPDDRPVVVGRVFANLRPQNDRAVGALGWGYARFLPTPGAGKGQKEKPGHDWSDLLQLRHIDGRWTVESIRITKGD